MRSFLLSTFAAVTFAAEGLTDYTQNGANWPDLC
jgi:hypothetical protein